MDNLDIGDFEVGRRAALTNRAKRESAVAASSGRAVC
jgi:hypothetical protein